MIRQFDNIIVTQENTQAYIVIAFNDSFDGRRSRVLLRVTTPLPSAGDGELTVFSFWPFGGILLISIHH